MTETTPSLPFADGKAPDALRTIGEVASALGIRQHVLRYWEEQFPMLRPLTRSGGRRYYRPSDIALLERINHLVHQQGFTLRGARLALDGKDLPAPADHAQPVTPVATVEQNALSAETAQRLRAIRARLSAALG